MKKRTDPETDITTDAAKALVKAREAFTKYLEDLGNDPAYFDIRFTAWLLDSNFEKRLEKIEIEQEIKEGK